mgnify:CR=1 FL=1
MCRKAVEFAFCQQICVSDDNDDWHLEQDSQSEMLLSDFCNSLDCRNHNQGVIRIHGAEIGNDLRRITLMTSDVNESEDLCAHIDNLFP